MHHLAKFHPTTTRTIQPPRPTQPNSTQVLGPEGNNPATDASSLSLEPPRAGSALSQRLCALLAALRADRAAAQPAFAVRQGTPAEAVAMPLLIEDRAAGQMSYGDFLMAVHKQVMSK